MNSKEILGKGRLYAFMGEPRPPLNNGIRLNFDSGDGKGYLMIEVSDLCRNNAMVTLCVGENHRRTNLTKDELMLMANQLLSTAIDMEHPKDD